MSQSSPRERRARLLVGGAGRGVVLGVYEPLMERGGGREGGREGGGERRRVERERERDRREEVEGEKGEVGRGKLRCIAEE